MQNLNEPELIVMFKTEANIRLDSKNNFKAKKGINLDNFKKFMPKKFEKIEPIFTKRTKSNEIPDEAVKIFKSLDFDVESMISIRQTKDLETLQASFLKDPNVQAAYIKPAAQDPAVADWKTPDLSPNQGYLGAAPLGIDAQFAWKLSGGRGENVKIIDVEQGFDLEHEDLPSNFSGLIAGNNSEASKHHGTAVLGILGADDNGQGITGISHNSNLRCISHNGLGTAQAIIRAADELSAGDLILLEVHRPGPAANGNGQDGFIAIEWWPDDFAAITYATSRGIVVVEAAGNGSEDFDAVIYDTPATGFPGSWKNPFNKANPQSGAVIIGAGLPGGPTDRTILGFSNWGSRVDTQGWGVSVASTGYGGLQGDMALVVDPANTWKASADSPKTISSVFSGLNNTKMKAGFWCGKNNKIYVFYNPNRDIPAQYYRIDATTNMVEAGYPKDITGNWPGLPAEFNEGIDAALWNNNSQKIYFFKNDKYVRIDPNNGWNVEAGYPKNIAGNWPGLPASFATKIDAAMWNDHNNKVYMFKNKQYVRIDPNNNWAVEPGYPKNIAGNWPDFPFAFTQSIDAAIYNNHNKKLYVVKSENILYTNSFSGTSSASPVVTGAIACIQGRLKARGKAPLNSFQVQGIMRTTGSAQKRFSGADEIDQKSNWRGVNATFGAGIDAAVWNGKSNKVYFFDGSQFVRIDPAKDWNVEAGYPKAIDGNWPGFPTSFANGIDTGFWAGPNQKVYFFKGSEYLRVDPNNNWTVEASYPKPIMGNWPGLPVSFQSNLNAGFWNNVNNKIYLFKGSEYVRLDPANNWAMEAGYPKAIAGNWPGLPVDFQSNLDSAIWTATNNKIYFFKGENYVRIDPSGGWNVEAGYPKLIANQRIGNRPNLKQAFATLAIDSNWPGMPAHFGTGVDAAMWALTNNKIYFFKGSEYTRVNPAAGFETEPGYPKPIAGNWPGLPANFQSNINASLFAKTNNKIYLFKGAEYVRLDPANNWAMEAGYPKAIAGNWPGLPANFQSGIDSCLWNDASNKIYFFKGAEFVRIDPTAAWAVEPGYPKPIVGNWPGLNAPFTTKIDAGLWNHNSQKAYLFNSSQYVRINPAAGWQVEPYYPKAIIN